MSNLAREAQYLDADAFLRTGQSEFGTAWRYELVRGVIVAHAAPTPDHGVILGNLAAELHFHLRGRPGCRLEVGSGAVPRTERRDTARIPDAMIRCDENPRVVFEVVSPFELSHKRLRDERRSDLQAVEGVREIIEIYQDEVLAHAYRRHESGWVFTSIAGTDGIIALPSVTISIALGALYDKTGPGEVEVDET